MANVVVFLSEPIATKFSLRGEISAQSEHGLDLIDIEGRRCWVPWKIVHGVFELGFWKTEQALDVAEVYHENLVRQQKGLISRTEEMIFKTTIAESATSLDAWNDVFAKPRPAARWASDG